MKKTLFTVFFLLGGVLLNLAFRPAAPSDAKGMDYFKGTFSEAVKLSEKTKKPIFFDAYTSWCGWCKRLDANTLSNEDVFTFMNKNFINVKMDMESPEGKSLGRKYAVNGYPTLLFINGKGEAFHRIAGYAEPEPFLNEAKQALSTFKGK
jgi:thioredoxin 1